MPKRRSRGAGSGLLTPAVFHILLALSEGALHGYGIMQSVEHTSGLEMGPGTIYGSIQRMEDAGLVREAEPPANDGDIDSRRRYYVLTADGREALEQESERVARLAKLVRDKKLLPGGDASR